MQYDPTQLALLQQQQLLMQTNMAGLGDYAGQIASTGQLFMRA